MRKTLIFPINIKVTAFLSDSPLSFCGLETRVVCGNLAGCNEKCKFILLHNPRGRERDGKVQDLFPQRLRPSPQFLDQYVQEEVLSVRDGMEALVSRAERN